jgi:hypothetical protein
MAGLARRPVILCCPFDAWDVRGAAFRHAPDAGAYATGIRTQLYLECYCVPADGTRAAIAGKRRLRYVCVFWAALGQAGACSYLITWGAGRKAQWLVEIKAGHLLGVAQFAN